jgi:hypothetical protein
VHVRLDDRVRRCAQRVGDFDAASARIANGAHDRVQQQVDLAVAAVDLGADGVDEERHVVVHDLDQRVLESPAGLLGARVVEADLGRTGRALRAEVPQRERGAEERLGGGVDDVVGRDVREVAAHEVLDARGLVGRDAAASFGRQPVDEVDLALFSSHGHQFSRYLLGG